MVGVMKIMVTSFKKSHECMLHSMLLSLHLAPTDTHLHWRFLDTYEQVWVSLLCSHFSFLPDPGVQTVLLVPAKRLFPSPM